jgi:hypothetical protein
MKLVKSLLLGSAAGLAAVAGAQAADLPVAKAAPVEYVRVCSAYGAGFFFIPGTDTCVKVGGRVRADAIYVEPADRGDNIIDFRPTGRIQLDARTATAYGQLRAFVRLAANDGGASLDQAFIQFGGLTAGRTTSFFSNGDLPTTHFGTLRFDDAPDLTLFAYTFAFGNGFSATLSLEDGLERRVNSAFGFGSLGNVVIDPVIGYGGQSLPDVVANLKYDGTWGGAQLSGALHQIRHVNPLIDTEYGYAIGASAYVNLPALAPGDALWIFATYANGAPNYSGFGDNGSFGPLNRSGSFGFGGVPDAVVNGAGELDRTETWNVAGGLTHNWGPTLSSSLFGSYAVVEFGNGAVIAPAGTVIGGLADFREWRIGANTIWQPVSGLNIGLEVIYADAEFDGAVAPIAESVVGNDIGAFEGRIRVQRDF